MCSLVILYRPGHRWPILVAANRDEMQTRAWLPPGRHWPDRPEVVAGRDETGGGSWLGINDHGVFAAVLNRVGTLGPAENKRSRGELVLEALDHERAATAEQGLSHIEPRSYRGFNLIIADSLEAFWLRLEERATGGGPRLASQRLPQGLSMITAQDLNDLRSPRIAHYLPRFRRAPLPEPENDDWESWCELLRERSASSEDPRIAMTFEMANGFATVSSTLIALPGLSAGPDAKPRFLFAPGAPDCCQYMPIDMD
jgi:uncharacterized protein with NRDE domain